ncbi:MAG: DegT/DnrJ/EryC1/StrS family aminotransferase [Oceanipulchritudo sp.]
MNIRFPDYPSCTNEIIEAVTRQLQSGKWTRLEGAPELESEWEAYLGAGHAWFLSSGTAALEAILLGHDIGPGDEIITTPYTWGASVAAILAIGAVPVFADIDFQTGQIDPESVKGCIGEKTRGILAVHLFGIPSPMRELAEIASEKGLLLFEDASQAHGARIGGRKVGTFGDAAAFSCMGLKPLGATEGGLAVFKSAASREKAYLYGRHPRGMDPDRVAHLEAKGLLDTLQLGWRPSAISAAILSARLPRLDAENRGRRENARYLRELLEGIPGFGLPGEPPDTDPVYHLLSFIVDPAHSPHSRDGVLDRLRRAGLPAFPYIPRPVHRMKRLNPAGYEGPRVMWHPWLRHSGIDYSATSCPRAEMRAARALEFAWNFTGEDPASMEAIAKTIRESLS